MSEILRNVAPFKQPSPQKNPGGDCFACALKAAVDALFPDRPISFDDAWEAFMADTVGGGKALSNTWPGMRSAVYRLRSLGYKVDVRRDLVVPVFDAEMWSHNWWYCEPTDEWSYRLEAWLASGWIALAEMHYDGRGPLNPDGTKNMNDHFIVIDGQRHFWKEHPTVKGAASLEHETHVVCSAKGAYWIDTQQLLRKHGVAGLQLIRKDTRGRRA